LRPALRLSDQYSTTTGFRDLLIAAPLARACIAKKFETPEKLIEDTKKSFIPSSKDN
jgi:hypothetical protein